ncbi:MAG: pentatricopeptide repeat-containing protein, partial [Muribaculum sp.]|nr:pentatricopeptide repeat-containing protein [Muribaculum sp.]
FPKAFGAAAQDGYIEAQESYQSLFEDTAKYNAIMSALAEVVYREMRKKGIKRAEGSEAYTYEMPQGLSMAAEDQGVYGDREEQK